MTSVALYVVSRWGEPTETFVRREVDAMRAGGCNVEVLSLKRPIRRPGDPRVHHLGPVAVVGGAVHSMLRHPLRAGAALVRIIVQSRPRTLISHLVGAAHGLAAVRALDAPSVVHAHFAWVAATAADVLTSVVQRPFSLMAHAFDIYDERYVDRYLGDKLRRADFVAVESDRIADDLRVRFRVYPHTLRIGVPRSYIDGARPRGERDGSTRIISVGSLVSKKGHDVLVRAAARLPVELTIVGGGPERASLIALADTLGMAGRVTFTGPLAPNEVIDELDGHDVFALASRVVPTGDRDGVPNVLIEAMARGLPVVASDLGGVADLVAGVGALVRPEDHDALATVLAEWVEDPEQRRAMGRAGQERIRAAYVAEDNVQWLIERFEEAAGG